MSEICVHCNGDLRKVYIVRFASKKLLHAVTTKHSSLNCFYMDSLFGGGFSVACGLPAKGKATLSYEPVSVCHITCKKCLKTLGEPKDNKLVPGPHLTEKEKKVVAELYKDELVPDFTRA